MEKDQEFKITFDFIASFRPVWATGDHVSMTTTIIQMPRGRNPWEAPKWLSVNYLSHLCVAITKHPGHGYHQERRFMCKVTILHV